MKSWIKGGLIGLIIYVVISLIMFLISIFSYQKFEIPLFLIVFLPGMYFFKFLGFKAGGGIWILIYVLTSILIIFIIGALIGWIISKVRR